MKFNTILIAATDAGSALAASQGKIIFIKKLKKKKKKKKTYKLYIINIFIIFFVNNHKK